MTKSTGAKRAAHEIAVRFVDGRHLGAPERIRATERAIAEIIDREEIVAKLLEALQQADDTLSWAQHFLSHANKQAIPDTLAIIRTVTK